MELFFLYMYKVFMPYALSLSGAAVLVGVWVHRGVAKYERSKKLIKT